MYKAVKWGVLLVMCIFTLFPVWVLVSVSLSTPTEAGALFRWFPRVVDVHSYIGMWRSVPLLHAIGDSLVVSLSAAGISLFLSVLASYSLTRHRVRGSGLFLRLVLLTQMCPGVMFLLPLFALYVFIRQQVGVALVGTYWGLIITYLTFALPFSLWMILGYVKGIPRDVEEAGMVDGLGRLAAFARLTLRMALPGVLAVGVFAFMTGWGEVLFASVLTTPHTETLPIALIGFQTGLSNVVNWNQLMAAALTVSIPIVGVFLSLQRYFVRGLGGAVVQ